VNFEHVYQFYKQIESLIGFLAQYGLEAEEKKGFESIPIDNNIQTDPLLEFYAMTATSDDNSTNTNRAYAGDQTQYLP
jgi:hypothetical protein